MALRRVARWMTACSIDAHSAESVLEILRALSCEVGKTVIMVTHDPRAASRGTRSLHLEKGRLLTEKKDSRPFS